MPKISIPNAGAVGVIKDRPAYELPLGAWSDARNVRFLDGAALQFFGHGEVYGAPLEAPQYLLQVNVAGVRYWLYATATKQVAVTNNSGASVHTDISHATARAGTVNAWSGFVFGGVPVLNAGDGKAPMYWNQSLTAKFADLTAWPANTSCKVLRQYKNMMIALNVTKTGTPYPFMVKWSNLAVAGALPSTWDPADATQDAGEFDLSEGQDPIIDGLGLKDSFIVYKEGSTWALDYIGGQFILKSRKVSGMSGLLNMNCAVEFEAGFGTMHFAVTGSDVVIHDGYTAKSVLDKLARRSFFQSLDVAKKGLAFCFKNPFLNEIGIAYPSIGATWCDTALVYNYVDNTVSFRSLPNVTHAACGPVDNSLSGNWSQDNAPWDSDLTAWNGPDFTPDRTRVMMGGADNKLYLLDASASFNGALPDAYLERRGLHFDAPERIKLITGLLPRITGNQGGTVLVRLGWAESPGDDPTWNAAVPYTIGKTMRIDDFVSGRYLAIRFETGTAFSWRLDSMDVFVEDAGEW
ncbi:hypothetical protein AB595_04705 [Massilia sp. WF1]|uniref:hypothetical protein n=1 Tax=unclassified Massilia TaxID=2609279 RepID=UPI00064AE48A|nr:MULTISPECIES: hypothetical protein [unclassified Massilia]ALK96977.1 hypothetical protein AM586_12615 [Massilia sp. WG5]KLU37928.1 hypothetical protein AB595_04705 [Massilia sp. WF1]